ncbi:hypothetical protein KI387_018493, partial [Taxus chinensis]
MAYRCYNKQLQNIVESTNVKVDETHYAKTNTQHNGSHEEQEDDEELESPREEANEEEERSDTKEPS